MTIKCKLTFIWLSELQVHPDEVELVRRDYAANNGWETFLSYEDVRQVSSTSCSMLPHPMIQLDFCSTRT